MPSLSMIQLVIYEIVLILTAYNKFQTFCSLSYLFRLAISRVDFAPKNKVPIKKDKIFQIQYMNYWQRMELTSSSITVNMWTPIIPDIHLTISPLWVDQPERHPILSKTTQWWSGSRYEFPLFVFAHGQIEVQLECSYTGWYYNYCITLSPMGGTLRPPPP